MVGRTKDSCMLDTPRTGKTNRSMLIKRPADMRPEVLTDKIGGGNGRQEMVEKLSRRSWLDGSKSYGVLKDAGIGYVLELVSMTKSEFLEIDGVGGRTADAYEAALADMGLSFGMKIDKEIRKQAIAIIERKKAEYEARSADRKYFLG